MRFTSFALVALSTFFFVVDSVPFPPQDTNIQRNRRRTVDHLSIHAPVDIERRQPQRRIKRANYSVVQVDGSPQSTAPPAASTETVTQTVTKQPKTIVETTTVMTTAPEITQPPKTVTVLFTQVITEPASEKTVVVTKTKTVDPPPITVTEHDFVTLLKTVKVTPTPTTKSLHYYDNGMWHTSYVQTTTWGNYDYDWSQTPSSTQTPTPSSHPTGGYWYGKRSKVRRAADPKSVQAQGGWNATTAETEKRANTIKHHENAAS